MAIDSTGCDWYTQWVRREGSLLRQRGVLFFVALALVASSCTSTGDTTTTAARPVGSPATIGKVDLEVTPGTTGPGVSLVPLSSIPIDRIWAANDEEGEGASAEQTGFEGAAVATPLGAIDLDASPLGAIPLGAIPLGAIEVDATPLGAILLSSLPVDGGWEQYLEGTDLDNKPLQTITLKEALDDEKVRQRTEDLTIAQVGLEGSPLGAISLVSLAFGDTPLGAIPLGAEGEPANKTICKPGFAGVPEDAPCDEKTTLFELEVAGASIGALMLGSTPLGAIDLETSPLGAIDLAGSPLGAIPLGAIPLGAIPLGAIPLGAIPLGAIPLGAIPLGAIPLGAIPLGAIDLLGTPLGAIPLGAIPLGAIGVDDDFCVWFDANAPTTTCADLDVDDSSTLHDLAAKLEAAGSGLADSPLGAIPLGAIPLGAIVLNDIPLGAIPLGAIALKDVPLGAIPLGAIGVPGGGCDLVDCAAHDLTDDSTLYDLAVAIEPDSISSTELGNIPLGAIPLGAIVLGEIPLGAIGTSVSQLSGVPLGAIPLGAIDVGGDFCDWFEANTATSCDELEIDDTATFLELAVALDPVDIASTPLGAIPLGAIPLGAIPLGAIPLGAIDLATSPLGAIEIGELPTPGAVVSCSPVDCATLADAQEASALVPGTTLEDLGPGFLFGFGRIDGVYEGLTLGDLLVALMIRSDYPWEELPFEKLGVQDFASDPNLVTYTVTFDVDGGDDEEPAEIRVALPDGFRYRIGSSMFQGSAVSEPTTGASSPQVLTWRVEAAGGTPGQQLVFSAVPSLTLGTGIADVVVTAMSSKDSDGIPAATPVTVEDRLNDELPIDLPNDTWVLSYISEVEERDTFWVPAPGDGHRVTVLVGNPAADVDLVAYRPFEEPVTDARAAPLGAIAVADDGPNFREGSETQPETLDDIPVEDDRPVAAVSAGAGEAVEEVSVSQRGSAEDGSRYRVQITGYNDAAAADPYRIRLKTRAEVPVPICTARDIEPVPTVGSIDYDSLPESLESLFLVSPHRLDALHDGRSPEVLDGLAEIESHLNLASDKDSAWVISVDDDDAVRDAFEAADMNPCDPFAANDVAAAIRDVVLEAAELRPTLRFVTIIGSDDVIPMWRIADHTELANEAHFAPTLQTQDGNAQYGAMVTRHYLSDSPYFDLDPIPMLDRHLYVPELAGGRLVEGVDDILLQIDTFIDFDGVLDPQTAFAAGYDFLADGTEQVADHLDTNLGKPDCDEDENEPCPTTRFGESWDAADLKNAINADHGILSPNAHYDYYRALPASEFAAGTEDNLFQVGDITDMALGSIVFTMGCHAGLNVVALGSGVDDFAQAYAGQGASYLANTGYGYGDTEIVDLSEELMANFAFFLDGSMTLGQADVASRQRFFADQAMFTPYHEKSLQEAVLYGLPMYQIGGDPVAPDIEERHPMTVDPVTGLESTVVELAPQFNTEQGAKGTHYSVGDDRETQGVHDRPIQPFTSADITQDGPVASGAVFESLTTSDVSLDGDPAFFRPVIDLTGNEPELEAINVMFPTAFLAISTFNLPSTGPDRVEQRQQLNVIAGQYLGDGNTQRLFDEIEARVYYAPGETDDFSPPHIALVGASIVGARVSFRVDTDEDAKRVLVLYRDELAPTGEWGAADLVSQRDGPWSGGGAVTAGATLAEYLVQVVDSSGNTSVSTFKGEFYDAEVAEDPPMTEALTVKLTPDAGADAWAIEPVTVTVSPSAGAVATVDGRSRDIDKAGSFTIDGDGAHTVHVVTAAGEAATFGVAIDTSKPEIGIGTPVEGAVYELGATILADFVCRDAGSGVITCDGDVADGSAIATARLGDHQFTVTATDAIGNRTETTHTYQIVEPALIEHTVVSGESLWRIAAAILEEGDQPKASNAEVARLWLKIYDENRAVIGNDPDLILPGQRLRIPEDD